MNSIVRLGKIQDLPQVMELIQELADYEKEGDQVVITSKDLEKSFTHHDFDFFVAEYEAKIIGAAIFYYKFSTWEGKCIYLEDLIVTLEHREKGVGTALFEAVAKKTHSENLRRMEWQVLDWNTPAIKFYKKYKSRMDGEWINGKLNFQDLKKKFDEGI